MINKKFKLENIKLIISDFDGIFTDGKLCVYSDGKTSKNIDYRDIMAISIILKKNIKFAIISGEKSEAIEILKQKFPSIDIFQNERNKINVLKSLLNQYNINADYVLYIGDDINDIDCLKFVKYPVTVKNAHSTVKKLKHIFITKKSGGDGAVREIADLLS